MLLKDSNIEIKESLFWDTDINRIDLEKHAAFIVERVITMGSWENFKAILDFYGKNLFLEIILNIRFLDNKTLSFCSAYFNKPITDFRCYNYKQLNQVHWNY